MIDTAATTNGRSSPNLPEVAVRKFGSQSRTRTCNLAINSRLLCQLSYLGMNPRAPNLSTSRKGYCSSSQACRSLARALPRTACRHFSSRLVMA